MIKATTLETVHTSNLIEKQKGTKAFINGRKETDYKKIACLFGVQKK
ncbi:MAG: hypothetical protein HFJ30_04890 [Clostridia bacterium]|jgi:hypothetical protein|nr:hypothetical protein [Clostridia bacterium]MCI9412938.1 hypothetical protein [Clostridia bacterium]